MEKNIPGPRLDCSSARSAGASCERGEIQLTSTDFVKDLGSRDILCDALIAASAAKQTLGVDDIGL